MATLTYNATINARRNVSVVAGNGGALTGTVAVLIDNTANHFDVVQALQGIIRRYDRDKSKNSKVSTIATSGTTLE